MLFRSEVRRKFVAWFDQFDARLDIALNVGRIEVDDLGRLHVATDGVEKAADVSGQPGFS